MTINNPYFHGPNTTSNRSKPGLGTRLCGVNLQYAVTSTVVYMEPSNVVQKLPNPVKSKVAVQLNVSTPFTRSDVFTVSREKGASMKSVAACCPTTGCPFLVHSSRGIECATTEQLRVMVGGVSGRLRVICEVGESIAMSRRAVGGWRWKE